MMRPQCCPRIPGRHELGHPDQAEDVGLELAADLELDDSTAPRLAVAGVVDEHADRALGRSTVSTAARIEASSHTSSASVLHPRVREIGDRLGTWRAVA